MMCPHCHEQIEVFNACQNVVQIQRITLVDGEPFVDNTVVLEYPLGRMRYRFRCGHCGGDLSEQYRECLNLMRRGAR